MKQYPFNSYAKNPSNTLTALPPKNEDVSAHHLFEILKDEYGIIICPNGGEPAETVFRAGHIGALQICDNDRFFAAFDDLLRRGVLKE